MRKRAGPGAVSIARADTRSHAGAQPIAFGNAIPRPHSISHTGADADSRPDTRTDSGTDPGPLAEANPGPLTEPESIAVTHAFTQPLQRSTRL